jgi:hypothetical protein
MLSLFHRDHVTAYSTDAQASKANVIKNLFCVEEVARTYDGSHRPVLCAEWVGVLYAGI